MSENAIKRTASNGGGGLDLSLPEEVLAVIPSDPYDQLDLARKITSMAIASRVSNLESQVDLMGQKIHEKDKLIQELEQRALRLEKAFQDSEYKLKIVLDDNAKLSEERDALAMTTKKLGRDLKKLEIFKRQLMQSLAEDNLTRTETVDIGTYDQLVPRAYPDNDDGSNGYILQLSCKASADIRNTLEEAPRTAHKLSLSPYVSPRLTPTGTPSIVSTSGYSGAYSPCQNSGTTSPTYSSFEGQSVMSAWCPSSQQSSAAGSPPHARPVPARSPRINGKEFFRQARSRLSYEQFSAFLSSIKELNAQKQTREETLKKAEEIFGTENNDLYISFKTLLSRSVH